MIVRRQNLIDGVRAVLLEVSSSDPRIVASYLYGSSLRTDFRIGQSDIDILVVVTDGADARGFGQISAAIRAQIPNAEVTVLRVAEIEAGIHPGWSRHFFLNVARSGVHLQGPDCLSVVTAEPPRFDEAYRRLVQLCQRARLVVLNPAKAHEAAFWLRKYQHWIPLCLMELLDLHGTPEDRLHCAHSTFMHHFPESACPIPYPYRELEELQLFLEGLIAWIPSNTERFSARTADASGSQVRKYA